jgi:hypothetical protein
MTLEVLNMNNQGDLLPWILGALSIAAIAGAVTVGSTYKNSSSAARPVIEATPEMPPVAIARPAIQETAPVAALVAVRPVDPSPPPEAMPSASAPLSTGQIWECTIHGEKTFSNNPCGENSSLREVAPINTMEATRVLPRARAYPTNGGGYADSYAPDDAYSSAPETSSNGYPVYVAVPLVEHRRPDRDHHPSARDRMPMASPPRPPSPPPPPRTH